MRSSLSFLGWYKWQGCWNRGVRRVSCPPLLLKFQENYYKNGGFPLISLFLAPQLLVLPPLVDKFQQPWMGTWVCLGENRQDWKVIFQFSVNDTNVLIGIEFVYFQWWKFSKFRVILRVAKWMNGAATGQLLPFRSRTVHQSLPTFSHSILLFQKTSLLKSNFWVYYSIQKHTTKM